MWIWIDKKRQSSSGAGGVVCILAYAWDGWVQDESYNLPVDGTGILGNEDRQCKLYHIEDNTQAVIQQIQVWSQLYILSSGYSMRKLAVTVTNKFVKFST